MSKKLAITSICLIMMVLFCSTTLFAAEAEVITVTGKVIALYNDTNKIIGVSIEGTNGLIYDVSMEGKGKELQALIEKKVEVSGVIKKDQDGFEILTVQSFKVLTD